MNIFRSMIWALLLNLLFGDFANALPVKSGAGFYAGANYSAFVAGKLSGEDTRTDKRKFLTVTKGRLMDSTLESFGGKIGFTVSGISMEAECLYGRTTSSSSGTQISDSTTKTETNPTSAKNFDTEPVYLLGILNTNLESSGVTLLSPYVGIGIGSGSILTEGNDGYGFPLITQLRMGLKSDLELFSVAIKPYFGYRLMLISSLCAKKLTGVPAIVIDHLDPNLGIIDKIKGAVSKIREMSHVSHNIEAGIVFYTR